MALYDRQYDQWNHQSSRRAWLEWLIDEVGVDYFGNVVHVELANHAADTDVVHLGQLSRLEFLSVDGSPVTDGALASL